MSNGRLHLDETVMTPALAARLLSAQFADWSGLPMRPLASGGSDNLMIRLGDDMVLRFPRLAAAAAGMANEARWLSVLAPHLPLPVPQVIAMGRPDFGYPHIWSVLRWIEGEDALAAPPAEDLAAARALAGFVGALRAQSVPLDAPPMVAGGHLCARDDFTRAMIARITDEADPLAVTKIWHKALDLPPWDGVPVLVHADLHPLNLLTRNGTLAAVIDWGAFCAGDPAHDLICGWTVLEAAGRALFRDLLGQDDATWARGRALAFSKALMAAPYYRETNRPLHDVMRRTLVRTMADWPS
jgi:aminoglycoside phosphotransferase (APT) family kinase protein